MTKACEAAQIRGKNGTSEDRSQHSLDIGRGRDANAQARGDADSHLEARAFLEWPSIACKMSECDTGRHIRRKRLCTKENAFSQYHHWTENCYECENAVKDGRMSEMTMEGSEVLGDHTFDRGHTTTPTVARTNAVNACFSRARYNIGDIRTEAEATPVGLNRAVLRNTQNKSEVQEKNNAEITNQDKEEDLATLENIPKPNQSPKRTKGGVATKSRTHISKDPYPFAGVPLHPHFPKTPLVFHNGEIQVKETMTPARRIDQGAARDHGRGRGVVLTEDDYRTQKEKQPFNSFEGVPLPSDFPKTPLNFYRGEIVGKNPRLMDISALVESRPITRAITRTVSKCDESESVMPEERAKITNEGDQNE